jgi:3-hydroxy-9,10-secoandrosta-1,3,5(10)-triene-9,17-dione monooxygenase reductase component
MFDPLAFRNALGSFATGVTIVTARDADGAPVGLTANSFNSVSLDPPMVLWSLSLNSGSLPVFRDAENWAVHVLAADQQAMSDRFATPSIDKFDGLSLGDGPEGSPLIEGCAARFGCRARFEYEGGDHAIFLGEVVDFDRRDAEPLIYHGGQYGRIMRAPGGADLEREGLAEGQGDELALTERGRDLLDALARIAKR